MQNTIFHHQDTIQQTFILRGNSINPMIDAATPLLGMTQRLRDMTNLDNAEEVYKQVVNDILAVEHILQTKGYESSSVVSFRYVLCTFIDELAMQHPWNSQNNWGAHSLLVRFHNESWGGERVYLLLERLMSEPQKYKDLLEFIYICFCLGFRGRYKVGIGHTEEFNKIFRRLHDLLYSMQDKSTNIVLSQGESIKSPYKLKKKFSITTLSIYLVAGLLIVYLIYTLKLNSQTQEIINQLNLLLH
ncbi:type IVB secretion system protein IcmH/DotU [Gilliamella sp. Pas-s25]|uniref:type IVB secretion system protein IcmH/DotU n=1 Tax=Gilliamella sp. Pas-s25 TaxID=2687310 RepID=UPI00135DF6CC|nr:type IVB secretion system protein IcmH/DotU [Gilliamella sp. Pas-s25]MWP62716.1 DotU family type IV/VI secretion system protein [Gilliamella sp. Pas-s25]